jgi:hypothetical protein
MKISFMIVSLFFLILAARAEGPKKAGGKGNIIYKYKKYETFDLGNLEVKGDIIAPGDLSVQERQRTKMERGLLERKDFDEEVRKDIKNLR